MRRSVVGPMLGAVQRLRVAKVHARIRQDREAAIHPARARFFRSPDGKEDWIIYHANSAPHEGCGKDRSPRIQQFTLRPDGTPDFGVPVRAGVPLQAPSGTSKG